MAQEDPKRTRSWVEMKRTVLTFAYLRAAAGHALEQAETTESGRYYSLMTSMLCCAFSLEAVLNHIGEKKVAFWQAVERKASPEEKLTILSSVLGIDIDFGLRPYQSFKAAFAFRNALVHGRTEQLSHEGEQSLAAGEKPKGPKTKWEGLLNLGTARTWLEDTWEMTKHLFEQAGLDATEEAPYWALGSTGWHIKRHHGV